MPFRRTWQIVDSVAGANPRPSWQIISCPEESAFVDSGRGVTGNWRSRRVGEFTRPQNAQTADVREPEPRPAVELPILRNNVPVPRPGSSSTHFPCRQRSGSWPTLDLHYGVSEDPFGWQGGSGSPLS